MTLIAALTRERERRGAEAPVSEAVKGPRVAGVVVDFFGALVPSTRLGTVAATLCSCILLASIGYLTWRHSQVATSDLLQPTDAETVEYVGYWGDWVKKDDGEYKTEVRSERVSLTISPNSNVVRGKVVEGNNKFRVFGVEGTVSR